MRDWTQTQYGPLEKGHPALAYPTPCPVCGVPFAEGDGVAYQPIAPPEQQPDGLTMHTKARIIHWACRLEVIEG